MRKWFVLLTALLVTVAACGGSDDGSEPVDTTAQPGGGDDGTAAPTTSTATEDGGDTTPETEDPDPGEGTGPSTATVTLGDETYEFSSEGAVVAQCLTDLFGIFSVQLTMVDASGAQTDGSVAIIALHEDTDPAEVGEVNSVEVDLGDENWVADEADDIVTQAESFEPGMSQVDSVEIDGYTVRGTATFVRQNSLFTGGDVETLTGSFEATCGEERTS